MRLLVLLVLILGLLAIVPSIASASDGREYHYGYINVDINVLSNGDMEITETQNYVYTSGDFHYGERWILLDKVDSIDSVSVWEGEQTYSQNAAVKDWIEDRKKTGSALGGNAHAYATEVSGDRLWIGWWFPKTVGGSHTFKLKYRVVGGLHVHDEGDQVYWKAIFKDRDVPVNSGRVTLHLPESLSGEQLKINSYGVTAQSRVIDDRTIEFTSGHVAEGEELEIKVVFPQLGAGQL